jgi:hypothetical protein
MQGRVVYHGIMNTEQEVVNLENFRTGIYSVLLITREDTFRAKFIKQ